ncbi:uncharacterized protein LOC119995660 [Tripterygium wilfordii]|uniref:uncharacterized protein LOC119995660 n=1 Tax=Tripterygium wilfordii TaxID=458696 RepID=UPI0018F847E0|nr:uncharacterized protein LOC119995660 [Tripterygium wilfordii]
MKSINSFTCDACGIDGDQDQSPHLCIKCQVILHEECTSLPNKIDTICHPHPLIHSLFLEESVSSGKWKCRICDSELNRDYGSYYCPECNFAVHVNCAIRNIDRHNIFVHEDHTEPAMLPAKWVDPITCVIKEIKIGEDKIAAEIKHFSHEHNLVLINDVKVQKQSHACMLPISSTGYICADCDFLLHKTCANLPWRILETGLHSHGLSIFPSAPNMFAVHQFHTTVNMKDISTHSSMESERASLIAVPVILKEASYFSCFNCNFTLDFQCATLPLRVKHKDNWPHDLALIYSSDDSGEYYCDICELERDPMNWFYRCSENCDFDAHPKCALGMYPFVKFGGTYLFDEKHPHPLTLVQMTKAMMKNRPACDDCGEPCWGIIFEIRMYQL